MKKYLFIFLLSTTAFSQTKGGEAVYQAMTINEDEENYKKVIDLFTNQRPNVLTTASELEFTLKFNKENSVFYANEYEGIADSHELLLARALVMYVYKTWQDTKSYYIHNEQGSFVGQRIKNFEWKITSETKKIDNFLCYKATGFNIGINSKTGHYKTPVIAWFCPEIPYSYGSLKFGNLPGLILELQTRNAVFGLKSLVLKNVEIDKMPNVRIKTEEEYQKEEQKYLEDLKNKSK